jgi:hypothetical protein
LFDAGWWHWVVTIPLLAAHVALGPARSRPAFEGAALLCSAMAVYAYSRTRDVRAGAVQVRLAFLAILMLGLAPAAQWFHWVQLAGMTSMVTVGYCPLARMLALMPWNLEEPLTALLVRRTFLTRPLSGGILRPSAVQGGATRNGDAVSVGVACALPASRGRSGARNERSGAPDGEGWWGGGVVGWWSK